MDFLIKLIGQWLARRIERGSSAGAAIGGAIGLVAGIGSAYGLMAAEVFGRDFAVACYLTFCVPLTIAGALIGSAIGPKSPRADARTGIRLTRYNRAAGSLAAFIGALGFTVAVLVLADGKGVPDQSSKAAKPLAICLLAALLIGTSFVAIREVWYVDLGPAIFVRRLLFSRSYSRHDVQIWGFEIRPNELVQKALSGNLNFCMQFNDGFICRVNVRGEDSQAIVDLLGSG